MKLLHDYILVKKPNAAANVTGAGIILTATPKESSECEVLLVSDKVTDIKPGDTVRKYKNVAGYPIDYLGAECLLLRADGEIEFLISNTENEIPWKELDNSGLDKPFTGLQL